MQSTTYPTRKLLFSGLFLALGVLLPMATGHLVGIPGTILLPMHIPVLLCGLLCGWRFGLLCGLLTPTLSFLFTGMPALYPMLPVMTVELSLYGAVGGWLTGMAKPTIGKLYKGLAGAMLAGRLGSGLAFALLVYGFGLRLPGTVPAVMAGSVVTGLPGIALQLLLVPPIALALGRLLPQEATPQQAMLEKAKSMIDCAEASCVVLRGNEVLYATKGPGVSPLVQIYELSPHTLAGSTVVDKIIGKAAAVILVCGGASFAYGNLMSKAAGEYLTQHGIPWQAGRCVDVISNRTGNGICPIEKSVLEIDDPHEAYKTLTQTLEQMRRPV